MREIKCRGRAENGKWYEGYYVAGWMFDINRIPQPYPFLISSQKQGEIRVDDETVGQFTGLKDKNGIEIYEGDIVSLAGEFEFLVEWDEEKAGFKPFCDFGKHREYAAVEKLEVIEVVGFIHKEEEK